MAAARRRRLTGATLPWLWVLLSACAWSDAGSSANPLSGFGKMTVEEERSQGDATDQAIQQQLPLLEDPAVLAFVNDLGQDLVQEIEPQPFVYRFRVIHDPSLNAFAIPGGYIYFHSGTLLAATSVEELAGVMAHEIAHVKGRHIARLVEQSAIPNLLANLAGIAAAAASGDPAPLIAAQGVNVALQLRFTRELEAEADQLGSTFMARAGYDPKGMAVFFERIVAADESAGPRFEPPPYLYSHPDVELRIDRALERADGLTVTGVPPDLHGAFTLAQMRLARLVQSGRTAIPQPAPRPDRSVTDPALERARGLADAGDTAGAIALLQNAAKQEPRDPRVMIRLGRLLQDAGRHDDAERAYRQALWLDPNVALNYYRLGLLYKEIGDRVNAVFYLEQAERRFEPGGQRRKLARHHIDRITFPVIRAAGLADGSTSAGSDTVAGHSIDEVPRGSGPIVWWARIESRYLDRRDDIQLRLVDPLGETVQESGTRRAARPFVTAELSLPADASPGIWRVEAVLDDERVDRRTFRVTP